MQTQFIVKRTFRETIKHYEDMRKVSHNFTEEEYRAYGVKLREIRYIDAVEADKWATQWDEVEKIPSWEWVKMYHDYHSNTGVKRFDTALYAQGKLCAVCYGMPSRKKLILKLHAIGRLPYNNPLEGKVLAIMLYAADSYARILDSEELWICNPMNSRLVSLYQSIGYMAHTNNLGVTTHLSLRLKK